MNPAFLGTWNLDKSRTTGTAAFLKAVGFPAEQVPMFENLDVCIIISKEGDGYKFESNFNGAMPAMSYVVQVGKPTEVPSVDGTKAQLTLTVAGDAVKEDYKSDKRNWTVTRTVSGNEQKLVSEAGGAQMVSFLVKQ